MLCYIVTQIDNVCSRPDIRRYNADNLSIRYYMLIRTRILP